MPSGVFGTFSRSRVVTLNISPAPSQSLAVMSGVCTYKKPLSSKKRCMAWATTLRTLKVAWKVLVRGLRCCIVRRYSRLCRFFCMG